MKLTPWFPPEVKPVRVGVYELEELCFPFHYWDGVAFDVPGATASDCMRQVKKFGINKTDHYRTNKFIQNKPWRGIAKEPK